MHYFCPKCSQVSLLINNWFLKISHSCFLEENARPGWLFVYSLFAENGRDCEQPDRIQVAWANIVSEMHEIEKNACFWVCINSNYKITSLILKRSLLWVPRLDHHSWPSSDEQKNIQPSRVQQKTWQASAPASSSRNPFGCFPTLDVFGQLDDGQFYV